MLPFSKYFIVGSILVALAGCATRAGVVEFTTYKRAFDGSRQVSEQLIDRLAHARRSYQRETFILRKGGVSNAFDPNKAYIFNETQDPPLAAEYRRSMQVINEYNEIMFAYASGNGFDGLAQSLDKVAAQALSLVSVVSSTTPGFGGADLAVKSAARYALRNRSRTVFREKFRETSPLLLELIETLRSQTPVVFRQLLSATDRSAITNMNERVLVSDWVVLLDRHADLIRKTQAAIDNPSLEFQLSDAAESIVELRVTVEEIRQHLTAINAG